MIEQSVELSHDEAVVGRDFADEAVVVNDRKQTAAAQTQEFRRRFQSKVKVDRSVGRRRFRLQSVRVIGALVFLIIFLLLLLLLLFDEGW